MILTKEVNIVGNSRNVTYYQSLGYNMKIGKPTTINIKDLTFGSTAEVLVKCDICENEKILKYQKYIKNLNGNNDYKFYCCSKKCANEKRKLTTLNKYGVEYIGQHKGKKEKTIKTFLKNYGVENPFQSETIKEIIKQTNIEKFGVINPSQSQLIKDKKTQTFIKNFGVEHNMQNQDSFNKNQVSAKRLKTHLNSGLTYRGTYEKDFLDQYHMQILIQNIEGIHYFFQEKKKKYFPDFYIPELNLIVEIKNSYLYKKHLDQNLAKQKACTDLGFNYIFIIDKNYTEFNKIRNPQI